MPLYEYECDTCHHRFEVIQRISDPRVEKCPKCGAPFIVEKKSKIGLVRTCIKEGCDWEKLAPEAPVTQPEEATPVGAKP